jgi:formylglycine-generating enzyme required for sulfatase activity
MEGQYRQTTVAVGSFRPNGWGLYDMHGNVWEWCNDWYGDYPSGAVTDPTGAASGAYRVDRGGSWDSWASRCRSADRDFGTPGSRFNNFGFRLALSSVQ